MKIQTRRKPTTSNLSLLPQLCNLIPPSSGAGTGPNHQCRGNIPHLHAVESCGVRGFLILAAIIIAVIYLVAKQVMK
jgi:hypothetical protein